MNNRGCSVSCAGILAFLFILSDSAFAANATWSGTQNAYWTNSSNWSATPYPAGTQTATFNGNGGGKTTLANLIPRFYNPTTGRILIDGHDTQHVSLASLRAHHQQGAAGRVEVLDGLLQVVGAQRGGMVLGHDAAALHAEAALFPALWVGEAHVRAVAAFLGRRG